MNEQLYTSCLPFLQVMLDSPTFFLIFVSTILLDLDPVWFRNLMGLASCEGVEIIVGKRVGVSGIIDFDSLHPCGIK